MTRRFAALAVAVCCLTPFGSGAARADPFLPPVFGDHRPEPSLVFAYHGWRVDASGAAKAQRPAKTVKAITAQIDLVEHLDLPPHVLAVMHAVPILAEPGVGDDPD